MAVDDELEAIINETISIFADPIPIIYKVPYSLILIWAIAMDADSLFDAFESKKEMNFYLWYVKDSFEEKFPQYILTTRPCTGPMDGESIGYTLVSYIEFNISFKE